MLTWLMTLTPTVHAVCRCPSTHPADARLPSLSLLPLLWTWCGQIAFSLQEI